jgi:HJR/Mrr/RecB family endonuclease
MNEVQAFDQFGQCEKCNTEKPISRNSICANCYQALIAIRSNPEYRRRRLGQLAKSENGIIQFTRKIIHSQTSQRIYFPSNLEKQSQREINEEYTRLGRISEMKPAELTKARSKAPYAEEIFAISNGLFDKIKNRPVDLDKLPPREFEEFMAEVLNKLGFYDVQLTPQTRDKGRDILAKRKIEIGEILMIVECKKYDAARKIGLSIVERFLFTIRDRDKASCGLIATTSFFSADAKAKASEYQWQMKLADRNQIIKWIGKTGEWQKSKGSELWVPPV